MCLQHLSMYQDSCSGLFCLFFFLFQTLCSQQPQKANIMLHSSVEGRYVSWWQNKGNTLLWGKGCEVADTLPVIFRTSVLTTFAWACIFCISKEFEGGKIEMTKLSSPGVNCVMSSKIIAIFPRNITFSAKIYDAIAC